MRRFATGDRPVNLADLVRRAAGADASRDRPAVRWPDGVLTWAELDGAVDRAARALTALDIPWRDGRPPRVAVALRNTPAHVTAFFGALRAGMAAVPVNPAFTARELRHVLADSGAAVLVMSPEAEEVVEAVATDLPELRHRYVDSGGPLPEGLADPPGAPAAPPGGGEPVPPGHGESAPPGGGGPGGDLAVLLYTSGTEGDPKGAMLSHQALLANQHQLAMLRPPPISPADVVLLAVPLCHAYGLNTGLGAVAYHGACGVLVDRFEATETARMVADHRVTILVGVPSMYAAWARLGRERLDFGSVRLAISGAAPLDREVSRLFEAATGHHLHQGYGLTETAPVLTTTVGSPEPAPGSIGRPLPGVEMKLVTADGDVAWRSGGEAGPEEEFDITPGSPGSDPGQIVVRGPNLFSGYWPDGRDGPDRDGWWATGDVGYADADGDLHLVDRIGELILVSGFNVYPHEVERVLMAHPAVQAAAVIGVPHPLTGQTVKACVVPATPVPARDLLAHCERNLARFKCPTSIEFVSELPYSALGKVRKTALRGEADG